MDHATVAVRLTPRGGSDRIDGWSEDAGGRPLLKIRVSAPPIDGEANKALEKLLARLLDLPKSAISIVGGQTARIKQVRIEGLDIEDVRRRTGGKA